MDDETRHADELTAHQDEEQQVSVHADDVKQTGDHLVRNMFWTVLICGVALDRAVKWFEVAGIGVGQTVEAIPGVLNLSHVQNRGVGFGLLEGVVWVPILIAVLVCAAIACAYLRLRPLPKLVAVALGLLGAGAIGNLIDRLFFGHVIDLFEIAFIRYPVFNIADSMVTVGSILLVFWLLFKSGTERESG